MHQSLTEPVDDIFCANCKSFVTTVPSKECNIVLAIRSLFCCLIPMCYQNQWTYTHRCPEKECGHHLYLYIPGESLDKRGFRQDDLPAGYN